MANIINQYGQVKLGVRYVSAPLTSTLWGNIYSVYNADSVGSSSLKTSLYAVYNGESNTNDSFGSNNGTPQGGLTYTAGKIGNAFTFNGTNAYVSLPNNSFNSLTNDFSVSFWMNLTNSHSVDGGQLFSNIQTSIGISTYFGFQIGFYNNQIYFTVGSNTGNSTASTRLVSNALSGYIGTWVHVTCTHKQSTGYKIYVNGVLNNSNNGTYNPVYTTNHTPTIGAQYSIYTTPNLAYKLNGSMDALSVWNKELTQSEITELYNSGNGAQYITDSFYKPTTNDALNTYNGTAQGGLTYGVGKVGTAFVFNGTTAAVRLPDNSLNSLTGDFSISNWVYLPPTYLGTGGATVYMLWNVTAPTWANNLKGIALRITSNTIVGFTIWDGVSSASVSFNDNTATYLKNNSWVHITATRKGSTGSKLYLNGVLVSSNTSTMNPVYSSTFQTPNIGNLRTTNSSGTVLINNDFAFNGTKIDGLSVWSKELTQSEITELYNSGNGKQYPN
jgi:hypothetical protein